MRSRVEPRTASLVVAILVAALAVAPAIAGERRVDQEPGVLAFAAASHKPKPNPKPTPTPNPTPTPRITPKPKPTPAPTPRPTKRPASATPKPGPLASPAPGTTSTPALVGGGGLLSGGATSPSTRPSTSGPGAPLLIAVALGLAMVTGIAFLTIVRRRGPESQEPATAGAAVSKAGARSASPTWAGARGDESSIPQWLRPSVRAARFWANVGEPHELSSTRSTVTFREPAGESVTRMEVGRDGVALLDQRNETYASILARLGSGDEVDVHQRDGAWALVETPHGLTGWVPASHLTRATARRVIVDAVDQVALDATTAAVVRPAERRRFPLGRRIAKASERDPQPTIDVPWEERLARLAKRS